MPATFVLAIVFAVFTAGLVLTARATRPEVGKKNHSGEMSSGAVAHAFAFGFGILFAALTCLLVLLSSFNPVGTREIGIVTSFGELSGHLGSGPNFTWPWDNVTPIDDSYQLTDETFTVRIAGGQTASATLQVRWNAQPTAADDIFANYKTTAGVESGLLTPELNAATNTVLDGYDPLAPLTTGAAAGTPGNPNTTQLGAQIETALVARTGNDVNIKTLVLKPLVYDPTVQDRINSVTNQVAKTDVALQSEKTAGAQATANKLLEQNLANNPLVLVQQCMTGLNDGAIQPVAGFSCWPGSNSGIVIPSATAANGK